MTRRRQQAQQSMRRAQRRTARQLASKRGSYEPPDRDECHTKQWDMAGDDAHTVQAEFYVWRHDGRLVDFVVNLQVLTARGWESVERIDCCHGHCHHHPENGRPATTIARLDSVDDVEQAFRVVNEFIKQRMSILRG